MLCSGRIVAQQLVVGTPRRVWAGTGAQKRRRGQLAAAPETDAYLRLRRKAGMSRSSLSKVGVGAPAFPSRGVGVA